MPRPGNRCRSDAAVGHWEIAVGCLYRNHVAALQHATEDLLGDRLSQCTIAANAMSDPVVSCTLIVNPAAMHMSR
jgi:hypothetical protein